MAVRHQRTCHPLIGQQSSPPYNHDYSLCTNTTPLLIFGVGWSAIIPNSFIYHRLWLLIIPFGESVCFVFMNVGLPHLFIYRPTPPLFSMTTPLVQPGLVPFDIVVAFSSYTLVFSGRNINGNPHVGIIFNLFQNYARNMVWIHSPSS